MKKLTDMTREEIVGLDQAKLSEIIKDVFQFNYTYSNIWPNYDDFHKFIIPEIERRGDSCIFDFILNLNLLLDQTEHENYWIQWVAQKAPASTLCIAALLAVKESEGEK